MTYADAAKVVKSNDLDSVDVNSQSQGATRDHTGRPVQVQSSQSSQSKIPVSNKQTKPSSDVLSMGILIFCPLVQ